MTGAPSDLATMDVADRAERVRVEMDRVGADAMVVTDLANIRYLTGFTGSNAIVVVRDAEIVLVTDGRYREQAELQLESAAVSASVVIGQDTVEAAAPLVQGVDRLALEADSITWQDQRRWAGAVHAELVATEGLILALRSVKDDGEIDRLERACGFADRALSEVVHLLGQGITERSFARALETAMFEQGSSAPSFETIIASGPNSARPHARPSDRVIGSSGGPEFVVVDFGATCDGYHSDMTRTFFVGEPDEEMLRIYDVVERAQAAGVAAVRAGVTGRAVDAACRDLISDEGYGDAFVHGTGHGIGLVIHEWPQIGVRSTNLLAPGHCITVEPGVYLPGVGGVRIEDSVVVTATGCRPLTSHPHDPRI